MTPSYVLQKLRDEGMRVQVAEGQLLVSPADRLNEELRQAIRRFKPDLVKMLTHPEWRDSKDLGWAEMREMSQFLGERVTDGERLYQLWGITPRGAICFDGSWFRTVELCRLRRRG